VAAKTPDIEICTDGIAAAEAEMTENLNSPASDIWNFGR